MTETESSQNQQQKVEIKQRKKQFFLIKFAALFALIFFGYFGLKYWQHLTIQKIKAQNAVGKFDNVDSDIFDVSDEYKNQLHNNDGNDLSELNLDELKEKGAEFVYQTLVKNQLQINDLKEQIQVLRTDIIKNKNQERIGKIIFTYVDLRQKISAGENYQEAFKNFEILAALDENLQNKVTKLKPLLPDLLNKQKLGAAFNSIIPNLIINKNTNSDASFLGRLRNQISKLVIIRRIDGKNPHDVDGIIAKTEAALSAENYQEALDSLLVLDQTYHQILADFLNSLSIAVEVQKTDQEIFNYLKNLT